EEDENQENNIDKPVLWTWIENYTQICKYSLDIRKCSNSEYCSQKGVSEVASFLEPINGSVTSLTYNLTRYFEQRTVLYIPFSDNMSIEEPCSIGRQDQSLVGETEVVAVLI
ncbi:19335_t:CDS:2, partial [Racocetra persica]